MTENSIDQQFAEFTSSVLRAIASNSAEASVTLEQVRDAVAWYPVFALVGGLAIGTIVWLGTKTLDGIRDLRSARATEPVVTVPIVELELDGQDFVLLQHACIEHAHRLIADADTENEDFGPDDDLARQLRADAARLLAMHHEFTERASASELTAPCHGNR